MFVRELHLRDFRSWRAVDLDLRPGPTVFTGRNGFGKTNLLEALFYLATLRSHRVGSDSPLVHSGSASALVTATVENEGRELTAELRINAEGANKASINQSPARRSRDLLGILRTVLFAPPRICRSYEGGIPATGDASSTNSSRSAVPGGSPRVPTTTGCCDSGRRC